MRGNFWWGVFALITRVSYLVRKTQILKLHFQDILDNSRVTNKCRQYSFKKLNFINTADFKRRDCRGKTLGNRKSCFWTQNQSMCPGLKKNIGWLRNVLSQQVRPKLWWILCLLLLKMKVSGTKDRRDITIVCNFHLGRNKSIQTNNQQKCPNIYVQKN